MTAFALRILLLMISCLSVATPVSAGEKPVEKTLIIAADEWCPINCEAGDRPGVGIEIARRIFEPRGYIVEYTLMPWARALSLIRNGDIDAVIGANKNDDPTLLFPHAPLARMTDDFYVLKNKAFVYDGVHSLKNQRLGVIADYGYSDAVEKLLRDGGAIPGIVQQVGGDRALEQNIRKLLAGRIDVLIESRIVMDRKMRLMGVTDQIRRIGGVPQGNIYLAFSKHRAASPDLVRIFDEGIKTLQADGTLTLLYSQYGVNP